LAYQLYAKAQEKVYRQIVIHCHKISVKDVAQ